MSQPDVDDVTAGDDVTSLPETGTGVVAAQTSITPLVLVVSALMCAGVAFQLRTRSVR